MQKYNNLIRKISAECIGTFAIVFFGCGSIMVRDTFPGSVGSGMIPVVFGLVVACMIYAAGHISGAHFNPAVTLGFACVSHFPKKEIIPYWAAQILGGILAMIVLTVLLPNAPTYGATTPAVPPLSAMLWEAVLTFFLMFVIMAVATDTRAVGFMAGIAIGGTVMLDAAVGGPVTGASMNPARSIGPAIFEGELQHLWIYLVGPFLGALLGALTYKKIKCEPASTPTEDEAQAKGCC